MNTKRVFEIMKNEEICDVYYKNHPVWIQEIENHTAKIGLMDEIKEQVVPIEELYE